jgi:hypothetical protein
VAFAAHVSGVHVMPPLPLPPLLVPLLLPLLPPPEHASPPVIPKQIGDPAAKQQLAVKPSSLSTHDCTTAPGYPAPAHAVADPVAQVACVQVVLPLLLPPVLLPAPLLLPLLLPPHPAPTAMLAQAPPLDDVLLLGAQSAKVPTCVVVPETVCAVVLWR